MEGSIAPSPTDVPGWVRDAVFYQIFPDRFARSARVTPAGPLEPWDVPPTPHGFKGGDLLGVAERLDELVDLGVNALYLTPVFASASNHRYHTYDYLEVDPMLGGTPALRELIEAAHARDVRVVLDGVFNHVGRGFWPFHHVVENGLQSPYVDWFHLERERLQHGRGLQPYPDRFDAPAPGRADASARPARPLPGYRGWWNLAALPKLNIAHPPVREFLWAVAEHWLRFGADGWRLDVASEIDDASFWREFRRRCRAVRPDAYLVGEIFEVAPDWLRGDRFDGLMNYPLHGAILAFVAGASLDRALVERHHELRLLPLGGGATTFAARLHELIGAYAPVHVAAQLNLLSSHDTPRFLSLVSGDRCAFRLGALLQMTLPGAPCVYYGDEVGMLGGVDPECRRAFPKGADGRDEALRTSVRALIAARRAHPALRSDRVEVAAAEGEAVLLDRGGGTDATARGEHLLVALNAGAAAATLRARIPALAARRLRPLALEGFRLPEPVVVGAEGSLAVEIPARSGAVLEVWPA